MKEQKFFGKTNTNKCQEKNISIGEIYLSYMWYNNGSYFIKTNKHNSSEDTTGRASDQLNFENDGGYKGITPVRICIFRNLFVSRK